MTPAREAELATEYEITALNDLRRGGGLKRYNFRNTHIWSAVVDRRIRWVIADLVDGHYTNHENEQDLEEAFNIARRRHKLEGKPCSTT